MFPSQSLLRKKGPLGAVWIAACFHNRLKKDQIVRTSIASSVDKIIPEVHISYRILAQLLLGVVRIFSKQVGILYLDCVELLSRICKTTPPSTRCVSDKAVAAAHSYKEASAAQDRKPKREADHVKGNVVTPSHDETHNEQISFLGELMLESSSHEEVADMQISFPMEPMVLPYRSCTVIIPEKLTLDSFQVEVAEEGDTPGINQHYTTEDDEYDDRQLFSHKHVKEADPDFGFSSACFTPVRDVLPTGGIDIDLQINDLHCFRFLETIEEPQINLTYLEDHTPESTIPLSPVDTNVEEEKQHLKNSSKVRHLDFEKSAHEKSSKVPHVKIHDKASVQYTSGAASPEITVRTPAKKEQHRFSRKRKCLYDETMVLSNKILREGIHDSNNLICKRRKVPHKSLGTWKAYIFSDLGRAFSEQLIPYKPLEFRNIFVERTVNDVQADYLGSSLEQEHSFLQQVSLDFPEHSAPSETQVASELDERCELPACASTSSELERDLAIRSSYDEAAQKGGAFSVRTRYVASYLRKTFQNQESKEGNLNLTKILDRRNRKACATFFYETLVLKTRGCIEVTQESPYANIVVSAKPSLWELT